MMEQGDLNRRWAFALMDGLCATGCKHVVISPGARSTPLVLAVDQHPDIMTHVVLDERSAAFFALGLAKAGAVPVALVCTSGTAPAHWHPAVLEADAAGVALVLLSADRPPELRGCGANQTTDQIKLFGNAVRAFHELPPAEQDTSAMAGLCARLIRQACGPKAGPVHINVPFREPLLGGDETPLTPAPRHINVTPSIASLPDCEGERLAELLTQGEGLIICGDGPQGSDFCSVLCQLADHLGVSVLADPLANLRPWGGPVLGTYDAFLKNQAVRESARPDWVLRFGAQPVSKSLGQYLSTLTSTRHLVVDATQGWPDPLDLADEMITCDPARFCRQLVQRMAQRPCGNLRSRLEAAEKSCTDLQAEMALPPEAGLIAQMAQTMTAEHILFCGNSTPIRLLDSFLPTAMPAFQVVGNRGLSGIEGNISTAAGFAVGRGQPVVALLGDLTVSHDINALGLNHGANVTLVVINNGGGGIFEYLPHAGLAPDCFERYWTVPCAPDFKAVSSAYGCGYHRVEAIEDFSDIFHHCLTNADTDLIEVVVDSHQSTTAHQAYWAAVGQL